MIYWRKTQPVMRLFYPWCHLNPDFIYFHEK
jgi:hypothetical protein